MSRRKTHHDDQDDELTVVARDPGGSGRWLRLLPLLLGALIAGPFLWFSLRFSVEVASIASLLIQLDADTGTLIGVVLMTLGGFICLVGTLFCLFAGWRRDSWRWRWSWAAAAVACAALMPLLGLVTGAFWE
ncbi:MULTISPECIES: hypothetical protein [Brevibacterium]|uniref:Uncharacterized protein n=1 Tax=Brevibacterium salitolerans TaxID=1403566 RepID=A0ABN2WBD3_9MICO|nr:hypothetical protein [Brevibacterium sp.]